MRSSVIQSDQIHENSSKLPNSLLKMKTFHFIPVNCFEFIKIKISYIKKINYFLCLGFCFDLCCLAERFRLESLWCLLTLSRFLIFSSLKRSRTICSGVLISPELPAIRFFTSILRLCRFQCVVTASLLRFGAEKWQKF